MPNKIKPKPFDATDWALEQEVSKVQKLLLLSLSRHADSHTGVCWPSQNRLARQSRCARETANRELRKLETAGLIEARRTIRGNGSEGSKEYLVHFRENLAWPDSDGVTLDHTPVTLDHTPVTLDHTPCDVGSHPPVISDHTPCDLASHPIEQAIGTGQANKPTNLPTNLSAERSREETKIGVREDRPEMKRSWKDEEHDEEYDNLIDVLTEPEDGSPIHRRMVEMRREQQAKNAAAAS
jgi:hypothetical protein